MRLSRIEVRNFRRLKSATVDLASASFLIGPNNSGKSSIIRAIDALLSLREDVVRPEDFHRSSDGTVADEITISGTFDDIPPEVASGRGFRGRVVNGVFKYKKTYKLHAPGKPVIEALQYPYELKEHFKKVKNWEDLMDLGYTEAQLRDYFGMEQLPKQLPKQWELFLPDAVNWLTDKEPQWKENPGGFSSIVNSRLPRLLHIPSYVELGEFEKPEAGKSKLGECLGILFEDLLRGNVLAEEIQSRLRDLQRQMSPTDPGSLLGAMCKGITDIVKRVFPDCGLAIEASLHELAEVLRPKYEVRIYSNIPTDSSHQGTGLIRTAIFAMLRYHSLLSGRRAPGARPLIVAFEEPEIYLHPHAANLLRDTIYALGRSDQIVCTSHSPWMIDLSKDPQSISRFSFLPDGSVEVMNFGVSESLKALREDDRSRVKMLQAFDDELSRIFFAERVVIVEGDSEHIAINQTLRLLPADVQTQIKSAVQVVRARGKATIVSLARYLNALGIPFTVMHDRDGDVGKANAINQAIADAVGDPSRVFVLKECLENALGYDPPSHDKPFRVYEKSQTWSDLSDVPPKWKEAFHGVLGWVPGAALAAATTTSDCLRQ